MELDPNILKEYKFQDSYELVDFIGKSHLDELYATFWLLFFNLKNGGVKNYLNTFYQETEKRAIKSCQERLEKGISKDEFELLKLEFNDSQSIFKYGYMNTLSSLSVSDAGRNERITAILYDVYLKSKLEANRYNFLKSYQKDLLPSLNLMLLISHHQTEQNSKKKVQPTLRKEFQKFLLHLSKTSVYDVNTKVFDLSDAKNTTPLQSLQYALLIFRERLDKRLELKTPNTSIYKLFNAHFENHKNMTSQNWNNFKETNLDLRNDNDFYISLKKALEKVSL
jgi:hypothetical protein